MRIVLIFTNPGEGAPDAVIQGKISPADEAQSASCEGWNFAPGEWEADGLPPPLKSKPKAPHHGDLWILGRSPPTLPK